MSKGASASAFPANEALRPHSQSKFGKAEYRRGMERLKLVLVAAGLVVAAVLMAFFLAAAAPLLGVDLWWGAALGLVAGAALAAGLLWGARAARRAEEGGGAGRLQRLGSRAAEGERGPDGQAAPISARIAMAMTDMERRQHAPGAHLSYLRGSGEGLDGGGASQWEINYFSPSARKLLRLQVARGGLSYRVTAEMEHIGAWLDSRPPTQREAAWEGLLLRNLEVPPDFADSPLVVLAVAAATQGLDGDAPPPRVRQMTLAVARPTLDWAPAVFWIVEAEQGEDLYRYYCDVQSAEVLRREQLLAAPARPAQPG